MFLVISIIAIIGFIISLYTYIVENKLKASPDYKPFCDISDRISCSKPMQSPYASLFYFSNAIIGMAYYATVLILSAFEFVHLLCFTSIISALISCAFAYLLYFKIKAICLLCTAVYVINFTLVYLCVSLLF